MSILSLPPNDGVPVAGAVGERFSRAARIALVGLLLPPLALQAASSLEIPATGIVRGVLACLPVLAFCASGYVAGASLGQGRRGQYMMAAGLAVTGLLAGPAFGSLRGLTGRESLTLVTGVIAGAFALAFGSAAATGALVLRLPRRPACRVVLLGLLAGALGGVLALLPFLSAALRANGMAAYVDMALAVASALGCLIVPYRCVGAVLERALRRDTPVALGAPPGQG